MLALIPLVMNIAGLLGSGLLKITIKHWGKKVSSRDLMYNQNIFVTTLKLHDIFRHPMQWLV